MTLIRFSALVGFLFVFCVSSLFAATISVPGDYTTIQEAINNAVTSDTVLVDPGTYQENLVFLGLDIVVTSQYVFTEDSADIYNTIVDANFVGSGIVMNSGETEAAVFMGFTVKNGTGNTYITPYGDFITGGGFQLIGASPVIQHNLITLNTAWDGGAGIFSDGGTPTIQWNVIIANHCEDVGCGAGMLIKNGDGATIAHNFIEYNIARHAGGIGLKNSDASITRNVICNNHGITQGGGMWIYDGSNPEIINNTFSHNEAPDGWGGGVQVVNGSAPIFMNNIVSFSICGGGFVQIGSCYPDLSYNLFHDNTGGDYIGLVAGFNDITGDPAYVGGTYCDYHLTESSAAIDVGNPDPTFNDPDATRNDVGAFPYDQGTPLPVVLSAFSGTTQDGAVKISWNTASEIGCYGWYVQRQYSEVWVNVSEMILGHGTTENPQSYTYYDAAVEAGETYSYRLKQIDITGETTLSDPITVVVGGVTMDFVLHQNYPNPFNPETTISYALPEAGHVALTIYDSAGRLVNELVNGHQTAGAHQVTWNASNLPSGAYIYHLNAAGQTYTRTLTLVK
ncbi:T9SS type A sorting domain-containing protein [bacterium]|nr:T9SS type A sorting domain-containing protein [bacterium]